MPGADPGGPLGTDEPPQKQRIFFEAIVVGRLNSVVIGLLGRKRTPVEEESIA